jgi:hypothetical protein
MERTRILRRASELKILRKETYRMTRTRRSSQMSEDIKKRWPYELILRTAHNTK